ncbi:transmembrane protein, putative [Bodo saltans]|uniref:Transmembrane protein, putative n=1 Tax=Bodo saltans TaxID=75058 RepID=A0A0S4JHM6_BODSA|nr:transmembrane protein, putative [Bodo saltans]|eukprot:CUG90024.1 transmembrane protein, putative [Bodo saltans]
MKVIEKIPADSAAEGTQQSNDKAEAEDEEVEEEPVDPPAPTKSTSYTACYRKDIGRFSISPAMVVVLLTLMSIAFGENFASKGDVFEHAVARFLYFAVQVFKDRPVAELVDFIVGHFAVVGKDAQHILNAEHVLCPSNKTATVVRNVVAFSSLTLRMSASLNQDNLINGMMERSKPPRTEDATLSAEDKLTKIKREEACEQFEKFWKAGTGAWIETITGSVGSADVVLHIPGVLTLPIQCKDISESYKAQQIKAAMHRVLENQRVTEITVPALFSRKLFGLGAPVIPVLYKSRLTTLTHFTSKYPEKKMSVAKFDAIGPGCIMAEGIGEGKISKFDGASATIDEFCKVQRLHRIRQNLMLFELRPEEPKAVVVVATAPEQPEPKQSVPPTGKYCGSFCYKFTKDLYDYIMSRGV